MPYYKISLTYDVRNGDEVTIDINNIEAKNQADVLEKLPALLERIDQLKGQPQIDAIRASAENPVPKRVEIVPVPAPPPVREGRFLLQRSKKQKHGWVCTDLDYKVVVTFTEHRFNETKRVTFLEDAPTDYLVRARIMRELGDWLSENHYKILF
jgi:hypothetical protein